MAASIHSSSRAARSNPPLRDQVKDNQRRLIQSLLSADLKSDWAWVDAIKSCCNSFFSSECCPRQKPNREITECITQKIGRLEERRGTIHQDMVKLRREIEQREREIEGLIEENNECFDEIEKLKKLRKEPAKVQLSDSYIATEILPKIHADILHGAGVPPSEVLIGDHSEDDEKKSRSVHGSDRSPPPRLNRRVRFTDIPSASARFPSSGATFDRSRYSGMDHINRELLNLIVTNPRDMSNPFDANSAKLFSDYLGRYGRDDQQYIIENLDPLLRVAYDLFLGSRARHARWM